VSDAWHPQVNGVVTVLETLVKHLEENDFVVTIIHPGLFKTIGLFFYPEIRLSLFAKRKVEKLILETKPDFIHIVTEGPLGYAAEKACKKHRLQFTTSYHTHFPLYIEERVGAFSEISYKILRKFHNKGVATMVATQSLINELKVHGFTNLVLWPLGVDVNFFKRTLNSSLPKLPSPVFAYLGRIAIEKNVEEFLKLALQGTKLVIGDGPDRAKLEEIYSDRAQFIGYKKGQELVDWLSLADVLVFPSHTDTFGLVIVEALSCGVPVAAHNVTGPKDIIENGVDGYLDQDLNRAALNCLKLSKEKCREKALQYSWEKSTESFISNLVLAKEN
jgi:glycosyltransferase involved in cell wall biosynthesis